MGDYTEDKKAAYQTLHQCLKAVAGMMAPIAPFYADHLFQDIRGNEDAISVHLSTFPKSESEKIDGELEARMRLAQVASSLVHSLRKKEKIKVRQPLSRIMVPIQDEKDRERLGKIEDLIITETNVKSIEYLDDSSGVLVKQIKPNFRKLGASYGPKLKLITPLISQMGQEEIKTFESKEFYPINVDGEEITLTLEDVEISSQDIPGWTVASENGLTVALDLEISDELKREGIARDIVNRVQNLRKDKGLEVQDKIRIHYNCSESIVTEAFEQFSDYISKETQALSTMESKDQKEYDTLDIDGLEIQVQLEVQK